MHSNVPIKILEAIHSFHLQSAVLLNFKKIIENN